MSHLPCNPEESCLRIGMAIAGYRAKMRACDILLVTLADGFFVMKLSFLGPIAQCVGVNSDGIEAIRLIHVHQLDLQFVILTPEDQQARPRREMGYHFRE